MHFNKKKYTLSGRLLYKQSFSSYYLLLTGSQLKIIACYDERIFMMQSPQTPPVRTVSPLMRYQSAERCALQHEVVQPLPGLQEVRIVLGVALCAWLFLALVSFNPGDASFFNVLLPVAPVHNWCGWLGAELSSWLFVIFGPSAWIVWGLACSVVVPRSDMRVINYVVQAIAACGMIAAVSLLASVISIETTIGIVGRAVSGVVSPIGIVGSGLLGITTLFFSTLIFMRLTVHQFLMKVAVASAYVAIAATTVWQLLVTGIQYLFARDPRTRTPLEPRVTIAEKTSDELYDIPETEIISNAVRSTLIKPKGEPKDIVVDDIAEAQSASFVPLTEQEAEAELAIELEEIIEEAVQHESRGEDDSASAEDNALSVATSDVASDDDENSEEDDEGDDDDDDFNGGGSTGSGGPTNHIYRAATEEEVEEDSGPAVYTEPAAFTLPPLAEIFDRQGTSTHDAVFLSRCEERARILEEKLMHFGITGSVINVEPGPVITLFEYEPEVGNKVSRILALEDDLALSLKALSIRILAPVPGKSVVGFEIANEKRDFVTFGDVIGTDGLSNTRALLPLALGVDTTGNPVIADLATMPHLLVAGATGAGKSVGMNVMLVSLLSTVTPDQVRLILIDPKRLEFTPYADIPHLLFPIITNPADVAPVLKWVAQEMELRYELMAQIGVRNIAEYRKLDPATCFAKEREIGIHVHGMPYIVIMIDELADLMMVGGREIEMLIARIAQMARAAGIHMLVATQRPSVDVVTGLIKANFPSRIAFRVSTKIDSRTIIDASGAEKLLGKGDMLYMSPSHMSGLQRLHGAYVTDAEIDRLTDHLKAQRAASYFSLRQVVAQHTESDDDFNDPLYDEVREFINSVDEISISLLQRKYRVGFNRSARLIEMLERDGCVAAAQGGKPRRVLRD